MFIIGVTYFVIPLIATLEFSLRGRSPLFAAYDATSFADPKLLPACGYSFVVGLITIVLSLAAHRADRLLGPPARCRELRPVVEFITLLPFVLPPVVLVFGLHPRLQPAARCP